MVRKSVRQILCGAGFQPASRRAGWKPAPQVDALERRVLLAGDVIISELMAVNTRTLADVDGDYSDWVELRNTSANTIDLAGWHLTDERDTPAKWTFPSFTLAPGQHRVVFASGKNYTTPGLQLHTNFQLSSNGEYLALIRPDGTVEHSYEPFPEQRPDQSYGIGAPMRLTDELVDAPAPARYHLPAADPGDAWKSPGFDDAAWADATTGVGFESATGALQPLPDEVEPNDSVGSTRSDASANFGPLSDGVFQFMLRGGLSGDDGDYVRLGALDVGDLLTLNVAGQGSLRATLSDSTVELYRQGSGQRVTFDESNGAGADAMLHRFRVPANDVYFARVRPANAAITGGYVLAAYLENAAGTPAPLTGTPLAIETEPNNTVATANDASRAWREAGHRSVTAGTLAAGTVDYFRFTFKAGDVVTAVVDSTSSLDARAVMMIAASPTAIAFDDGSLFGTPPFASDAQDARIVAYQIPSDGQYYVGVQSNNNTGGTYRLEVSLSAASPPPVAAWFSGLIGTNVMSSMRGAHSSALVRVPFSMTEERLAEAAELKLSMKYDDGFVAYLNGAEVARRNAPGAAGSAVAYDAAATASRHNAAATTYEEIDVSAFRHLLVAGENVLAIHGLNASAGDEDFLVLPELRALSAPTETPPGYFSRPTPGAPNNPVDALGVVADTNFSHDRGYYDAPFDLTITTATPGAVIRYTTNGVPPTATTGTVYTGPVRIDRTTALRAAAFKPGYVPTNADTQTYLFLTDVVRQSPNGAPMPGWPAGWGQNVRDYGMDPDVVNNLAYRDSIVSDMKTLPAMSIVMKLDDLFGSQGIYSNPDGDGRPWERPASLELINPDGTRGFQSDIGLRLRGGFSRSTNNPKHGFRVFYRAEYGDADLNFPLFGPDGAESFDGFDLRTFNNYSWSFQGDGRGIFMRDVVSRDLQLAMGQPGERGDYYHLYINGVYWGIYNSAERPEASYGATYFGGTEEDYDVIKVDRDTGYSVEATDGNLSAWTSLWQLLQGSTPISDAVYQRVQGNNPDGTPNPAYPVLLDVDNLLDYTMVIVYGGNLDAPVSAFIQQNGRPNNFFALRNRDPAARQGFKFFVHDAEHTLLNVGEDRTGPFPAGATLDTSNPHYFFQRLATNPNFRLRVADRAHKHFFNGGVLTPQRVQEVFMRRKNELDRAVVGESARWGDSKVSSPHTRNGSWLPEVNNILQNYIPARTGIVLGQLRADGLYPTAAAPSFNRHGGTVAPGFGLVMSRPPNAPPGTIYYTLDGADPRGPDGLPSASALAYAGPVPIDGPVTARSRVLQGATWSALNEAAFAVDSVPLRVTEVMYHPAPPPAGGAFADTDFEFVELQNVGPATLDLSGVKFDQGIDFTFPDGTTLQPGAYAVLVRNAAAFAARYGTTVTPAGVFRQGLNDAGERLRLVMPAWAGGQTITAFNFSDEWFASTDGRGRSLVPRDPAAPPEAWEDPARWRASRDEGGSPGAADPAPADGVAGRYLFYNRTAYDATNFNFADSSDDNALDRTKRALLPGQRASAANYTAHTRGINGLFVDLTNLAHGASVTAADFVFRVGRSGDVATWAAAQPPQFVSLRRGGGVGGSDRVTISWPDGRIKNTWLQVTVKANARTGLARDDVFYFGHFAGDASNTPPGAAAAVVDARDLALMRMNMGRPLAQASSPYDFDHNGRIDARDYALTRAAMGTSLPMITAPGAAAAAGRGGVFSQEPVVPGGTTRGLPPRRETYSTSVADDVLGA